MLSTIFIQIATIEKDNREALLGVDSLISCEWNRSTVLKALSDVYTADTIKKQELN